MGYSPWGYNDLDATAHAYKIPDLPEDFVLISFFNKVRYSSYFLERVQ